MSKIAHNLEFHIESYGMQTQPVLLLFHGFMGSVADWKGIAPLLADRYTVFAFDLPGHGETRVLKEDCYRMDRCGEEVMSWLDRRATEECSMIGYSMGGRLAFHLAVNYPERFDRVIIESASPGIRDDAERDVRRTSDGLLIEKLRNRPMGDFVDEWYQQPMFSSMKSDSSKYARMIEKRKLNDPAKLALSLEHMGAAAQVPLWDKLHCISARVQLIAGMFDQKYRGMLSDVLRELRHGESVIIENAGHNTHAENPDEFVRHVNKFLSR